MKSERGGFRMLSRKQLLQETVHDAYQLRRKPREGTRCPQCQAIFRRGRWTRGPGGSARSLAACPACRRQREHFPAGFVAVAGEFVPAHRTEILALVRRCEARESSRHVLERVMDVRQDPHGLLVTTTGVHLARRIGDALHDAYKGRLRTRYNKADKLLRVSWSR
jgi:NMD protein affecting ribosome stability and mRNA decay